MRKGVHLNKFFFIIIGLSLFFFLCLKLPLLLGKSNLPFLWSIYWFYPISAIFNTIIAFVIHHLKYNEIMTWDKLLNIFLLSLVVPFIYFGWFPPVMVLYADNFDGNEQLNWLEREARSNNLVIKGVIEGKIEEIINWNNHAHRNWNLARKLYIDKDFVNFSNEQLNFLVENSRGKAAILTRENVINNSVAGIPLKQIHDAFQEGDLVRKITRRSTPTVVEYVGVGRTTEDLNWIAKWKNNFR